MSDATPEAVLGHFATYRATPALWATDGTGRRERAGAWLAGVCDTADVMHVYLTQGIESTSDLLVWTAVRVKDSDVPGAFFRARARADNAHRDLFEPANVLWGLTRPSEYSNSARSAQAIDPFGERSSYLVAYPFTKTTDWYLLGRDARQGMMNEHIRIGKQYKEITQLLLYSFGLQDNEFVVVYETDDLAVFSRLVHDLRNTEGRKYTKSDSPLHTGVLVTPEQWAESLA